MKTTDSTTTTGDAIMADSARRTVTNAALARMEEAIERLLSPTATGEDFLAAIDTEANLMAITRQYRERLKEASIDYIREHGEVETMTCRFYVGTTKTTKCRDPRVAIKAIFEATGGDLDAVLDSLTSQPLKPGACRGVLGDDWEQHFNVKVVEDTKTGKPMRSVQRALPREDE